MEDQGELDTDRYRKIEVDKVDAFQGREKDIIIVSCVQSLGNKTVGSLVFKDRFLLALTRAKFGLIIIGHAIALSKVSEIFVNFLCIRARLSNGPIISYFLIVQLYIANILNSTKKICSYSSRYGMHCYFFAKNKAFWWKANSMIWNRVLWKFRSHENLWISVLQEVFCLVKFEKVVCLV